MILQFKKNNKFNSFDLNLNGNIDMNLVDFSQILLNPNRFYCQKLPNDAIFDGLFNVYLTDLCGNTINQCEAFIEDSYLEFASTYDNGYEHTLLKIVNLVNNDVWWSNPFVITNDNSTPLVYRNVGETKYQNIDINCYFTNASQESDVKTYNQQTGVKVASAVRLTELRRYIFDKLDNFSYRNINIALTSDEVYLDNYQITDKPMLKTADILGQTNIFQSELIGAFSLNSRYTETIQIVGNLDLLSFIPNNINTLVSVGNEIVLTFNHDIESLSSDIIVLENIGVSTTNLTNWVISGNTATHLFDFTVNGNYKIHIPENKFISLLYGSYGNVALEFEIAEADYEDDDYDYNDYLTE